MSAVLLYARSTLLAGWRIRSSHIVVGLALVAILVAWVAGSFSGRQPQTVMVDIGFSLIRFLLLLLGLYWVQELFSKEIEKRTVLWICAGPSGRASYVIGRYLGVLALLALALGFFALVLYLGARFVAPNYHQPTPVHWGGAYLGLFGFLWLDLAVNMAVAIWLASLATVSMLPFFMGLAAGVAMRAIGPTLAYLAAMQGQSDASQQGLHGVLGAVQWILPDLSRYDIRTAVLYGKALVPDLVWAVPMQAVCYVVLLLFLASHGFSRREFN